MGLCLKADLGQEAEEQAVPNPENFVKFGTCPRCGRTGIDPDDDSRLTGYELKEYRGEYMCTLCIIQLQDQEHDQLANESEVEFHQFKHAIGMKNTPQ
jgi:predicted RNA-binding Zn-ribbon protein involved in translation (DUF1610 family)